MSLVVAGAVGCCCGEPVIPCVGCNAGPYNTPATSILASLELMTNGQVAPAMFQFVCEYSPYQFQSNIICRWIDPAFQTVQIPSTNGLGYYKWTIRGLVCQPQIVFNSITGYNIFPYDLGGFNGWAFFLNDGTFGGGSAAFAGAIVGKNQCTPSPQGQYGFVSPPSYSFAIVS
jgi:hypothetical protein